MKVALGGAADLHFSGIQVDCQLTRQHLSAGHNARLFSRVPSDAYFFRLIAGHVACSVSQHANGKAICGTSDAQIGQGIVHPHGPTQWTATCQWLDPIFQVAVLAGSVTVTDPAGHVKLLHAGRQLTYHFSTGRSTVTSAVFSREDRAVLVAQAKAMGLR